MKSVVKSAEKPALYVDLVRKRCVIDSVRVHCVELWVIVCDLGLCGAAAEGKKKLVCSRVLSLTFGFGQNPIMVDMS